MLFNCSVCTLPMTVQHFKKAMGERLKNGGRILWGKHFTIPHFSPLKIGTRMGKNGEKWGKNFMGKAFYDSPFFPIFPH